MAHNKNVNEPDHRLLTYNILTQLEGAEASTSARPHIRSERSLGPLQLNVAQFITDIFQGNVEPPPDLIERLGLSSIPRDQWDDWILGNFKVTAHVPVRQADGTVKMKPDGNPETKTVHPLREMTYDELYKWMQENPEQTHGYAVQAFNRLYEKNNRNGLVTVLEWQNPAFIRSFVKRHGYPSEQTKTAWLKSAYSEASKKGYDATANRIKKLMQIIQKPMPVVKIPSPQAVAQRDDVMDGIGHLLRPVAEFERFKEILPNDRLAEITREFHKNLGMSYALSIAAPDFPKIGLETLVGISQIPDPSQESLEEPDRFETDFFSRGVAQFPELLKPVFAPTAFVLDTLTNLTVGSIADADIPESMAFMLAAPVAGVFGRAKSIFSGKRYMPSEAEQQAARGAEAVLGKAVEEKGKTIKDVSKAKREAELEGIEARIGEIQAQASAKDAPKELKNELRRLKNRREFLQLLENPQPLDQDIADQQQIINVVDQHIGQLKSAIEQATDEQAKKAGQEAIRVLERQRRAAANKLKTLQKKRVRVERFREPPGFEEFDRMRAVVQRVIDGVPTGDELMSMTAKAAAQGPEKFRTRLDRVREAMTFYKEVLENHTSGISSLDEKEVKRLELLVKKGEEFLKRGQQALEILHQKGITKPRTIFDLMEENKGLANEMHDLAGFVIDSFIVHRYYKKEVVPAIKAVLANPNDNDALRTFEDKLWTLYQGYLRVGYTQRQSAAITRRTRVNPYDTEIINDVARQSVDPQTLESLAKLLAEMKDDKMAASFARMALKHSPGRFRQFVAVAKDFAFNGLLSAFPSVELYNLASMAMRAALQARDLRLAALYAKKAAGNSIPDIVDGTSSAFIMGFFKSYWNLFRGEALFKDSWKEEVERAMGVLYAEDVPEDLLVKWGDSLHSASPFKLDPTKTIKELVAEHPLHTLITLGVQAPRLGVSLSDSILRFGLKHGMLEAIAYNEATKQLMRTGLPFDQKQLKQVASDLFALYYKDPNVEIPLKDGVYTKVKDVIDDEIDIISMMAKPKTETIQQIEQFISNHFWPVLPFFRVAANQGRDVAQRLPVLSKYFPTIKQDLRAGGFRAAMAKARIRTGAELGAIGSMLWLGGHITPSYSTDPDLAKMQEGVFPERSLIIGDRAIPLESLGTTGILLAVTAEVWSKLAVLPDRLLTRSRDLEVKYGNKDSQIVFDMMMEAATELAAMWGITVSNRFLLNDLRRVFSAVSQGDVDALQTIASQRASSFIPYAAVGKTISDVKAGGRVVTDDIVSSMLRGLGITPDQTQVVMHDAWGAKVVDYTQPYSWLSVVARARTFKNHPEYELVQKVGEEAYRSDVPIVPLDATITMGEGMPPVEMTVREMNVARSVLPKIKVGGKTMVQALADVMGIPYDGQDIDPQVARKKWEGMSREAKEDVIKLALEPYRRNVRLWMRFRRPRPFVGIDEEVPEDVWEGLWKRAQRMHDYVREGRFQIEQHILPKARTGVGIAP